MMQTQRRVNLHVSQEVHAKLTQWATEKGWTLQGLMERLINSALKQQPAPVAPPPRPAPLPPPPRPPPPPPSEPHPIARVCPNCGNEIPLDQHICTNSECGTDLDAEGADVRMSDGTQDVDPRMRVG